jgi:hypothetical protein
MANAFTKHLLSESTDGKPIKLTQAFGPGIKIHTAGLGQTHFDEVYIYAANVGTATTVVTLEWGGILDPDHHIECSIPISSVCLVAPGLLIQNSLVIRAFADTPNVINIIGWVNRITVT